MTIKAGYAKADTEEKVVQKLSNKLDDDSELVVYFASSKYDHDVIAEKMAEEFSDSAVIGCTTAGEIAEGKMYEGSVSAMSVGDEIADLNVQVVDKISDENNVPQTFGKFEDYFGQEMSKLDHKDHVGIVLFDGLSGAEEKIMEKMGDLTNVPFVGASAGDDLDFEATHVFANGKAYTDSAVLALLEVPNGYDIIKTQSFKETGKTLTPTKVVDEERKVVEFNGEPAIEKYAEAIGVDVEEADDKFIHYTLGLMIDGEPFVRSPYQVVDDSAMKFYSHINEGMELSVLESQDIVSRTRKDLDEKMPEDAKGLINFSCVLRSLELKDQGKADEYAELFQKVPNIGFNTYGEEYLGHVNQTSTILVFK